MAPGNHNLNNGFCDAEILFSVAETAGNTDNSLYCNEKVVGEPLQRRRVHDTAKSWMNKMDVRSINIAVRSTLLHQPATSRSVDLQRCSGSRGQSNLVRTNESFIYSNLGNSNRALDPRYFAAAKPVLENAVRVLTCLLCRRCAPQNENIQRVYDAPPPRDRAFHFTTGPMRSPHADEKLSLFVRFVTVVVRRKAVLLDNLSRSAIHLTVGETTGTVIQYARVDIALKCNGAAAKATGKSPLQRCRVHVGHDCPESPSRHRWTAANCSAITQVYPRWGLYDCYQSIWAQQRRSFSRETPTTSTMHSDLDARLRGPHWALRTVEQNALRDVIPTAKWFPQHWQSIRRALSPREPVLQASRKLVEPFPYHRRRCLPGRAVEELGSEAASGPEAASEKFRHSSLSLRSMESRSVHHCTRLKRMAKKMVGFAQRGLMVVLAELNFKHQGRPAAQSRRRDMLCGSRRHARVGHANVLELSGVAAEQLMVSGGSSAD
ncbi:hypothetical protein PHYSODRAFT_299471 [Phytophthora sojae]|uniref:Uncharacterized protein n=1 Tax=Phytophthora sojae (strain P6497) TaxID=1094619 RepID=G4Z9B4_PHYSP|nr:hypothetical protein PHYSODRAFT_299471 [Phytophthora sojae]EGZ21915.1 hypothetical protein PHYSODRAFT_299471 [Phytophthora sojae]|eukprot:XP_009524632.1 hypothetical protein PHYSODRAFT_299471 [Phytophthora sojae]